MDARTDPTRAPPADSEAGVVAASVYAGGRRVKDVAIEEAGEWSKRPGHVVWIGLWEPSTDLLQRVQAQFALHDLAIEDAGKAHQHPKIEQYGEALFVVARTAQLVEGRIAFGETHVFIGRGFVVTVRHGVSTSYTAVPSAFGDVPPSNQRRGSPQQAPRSSQRTCGSQSTMYGGIPSG